ncbi:MAG: thioredoxin domain-containing protein, partial [Acetobacteraceae bacterium]|nr:thioredoxin domain-containing protein [Acetobacteraceae bacterium]
EERPDIDHLYMTALHALGEQGGWPLTMFLTPDGAPFWGGTYFPPTPRWGRPSFRQVLQGVADAFHAQDDAIQRNTQALRHALASVGAASPGDAMDADLRDRCARRLLAGTDPVDGGLRGAPKFPNPPVFRLLWQYGVRSGSAECLDAVRLLLTRMSFGGIHDHLGGGYARYATDARWLVPHFEKMLYDNAQILELLALVHGSSPAALWHERAAGVVAWMARDMSAADLDGAAAFAASEDVDSDGEEGRFYTWTEAEIDTALGADAAAFKAAYDVTPDGNWEGRTILQRVAAPQEPEAEAALERSRAKLFALRAGRVRPGRDDKVLADWNGLAIAALCRAAAAFGQPAWRDRAAAAFRFVERNMRGPDGRVAHAWRLGRIAAAGLLDDQAAFARASLALFEATGAPHYLARARDTVAAADRWFGDADGSYFATAADAADMPFEGAIRPRIVADNATPSGNGMMAETLTRLYQLTGDDTYRARAEALLKAFAGLGERLAAAPTLLAAADQLEQAATVAVAGDAGDPATQALLSAALAAPDPALAVLRANDGAALPALHPAHGKTALNGRPTAYVCRGGTCGLPITTEAALRQALAHPA